jgi:hypothetical protein
MGVHASLFEAGEVPQCEWFSGFFVFVRDENILVPWSIERIAGEVVEGFDVVLVRLCEDVREVVLEGVGEQWVVVEGSEWLMVALFLFVNISHLFSFNFYTEL